MRRPHFFSAFLISSLGIAGCSNAYETSREAPDAPEQLSSDMITPHSLDSEPLAQASAPGETKIGPDSKIAPYSEIPPAPAAPPATAPSLLPDLRYLQNASTVGIAVDAYARGLAIKPDNITLHKAYIRKVVDLDVPQLGRAAAERVLTSEPDDGLARAVLSFSEARQGQMVDALTNISIALKQAKDEPLVQRTAGHLLAWYDNTPNAPMLPQGVLRSVKDAQTVMQPSSRFAEAYKEASDFYREQRRVADAQPATRPAIGQTTGASIIPSASSQYFPEPSADLPDYAGYTGEAIGYSPYAAATSYDPVINNYYYENAYPYYDYAPFWGPAFGFGFFDFDFDRGHREHDRDRGRDRDRNREADHHFRDHFFGSSHREGTATGSHLRGIQRGMNSPMVAGNRSTGPSRAGVTQISPARGAGSFSRPPSNGPRGGNAPAPHGFPAQSGSHGGGGGGFHGSGRGGGGGGGGGGFHGGGGFGGGGMHGGGGGHR
jgi:hypothetical protein